MGKELDADCRSGKEGRRIAAHPWRGRDTGSSESEATFVARLARTNHLAHRGFSRVVTGEGTSFAG